MLAKFLEDQRLITMYKKLCIKNKFMNHTSK